MDESQHKPEDYPTSTYRVVDGTQRVIDFLKHTFGATELRRYDNPDGSLINALQSHSSAKATRIGAAG